MFGFIGSVGPADILVVLGLVVVEEVFGPVEPREVLGVFWLVVGDEVVGDIFDVVFWLLELDDVVVRELVLSVLENVVGGMSLFVV